MLWADMIQVKGNSGYREIRLHKHLGDLFAFSASTADDRWLSSLRLPRRTEKITDKVFLFQEPEAKAWRHEIFGKTHLLIIGSPAANLAARELNRHFIHRFAVPSEAEKLWSTVKEKEFPKLKTPAALEHFETVSEDSKPILLYMKAIPTAAKPCLTCHGWSLDPALKAEITRLYPDDQATNFSAGELRGAFTVKIK